MLRVPMGVNFFVHGASRLPHLDRFVATTVREFARTPLAGPQITAFAVAIPFVEVVLGIAIFIGAGLRFTLPASAAYLIVLMIGTLVRADYLVVTEQLVYCAIFAALVGLRAFDRFSLDASRGGTPERR